MFTRFGYYTMPVVDVYLTGTGLGLHNHLRVIKTIVSDPLCTIRTIHGISSGSTCAMMLLHLEQIPDSTNRLSHLYEILHKFQTTIEQTSTLYQSTSNILKLAYLITQDDCQVYCNDKLFIYYFILNGSTCQRVVESNWTSKNTMFLALARSCCIPFITMYPLYTTNNSIIFDGVGFMDTIPVPTDTSSVIISTLDIMATLHTMFHLPTNELNVKDCTVPTLVAGVMYIFTRHTITIQHTAYQHQFATILRWMIVLYPYLMRYKLWWSLFIVRIITYKLLKMT